MLAFRNFLRVSVGLWMAFWLVGPISLFAEGASSDPCVSSPCTPICLTSPCDDPLLSGVRSVGPAATFTGPAPGFTEGQQVTFEGTQSGSSTPIVLWEWDFDYTVGGFSVDATGQTVQHGFQTARRYVVALRVWDEGNLSSFTVQEFNPINIPPTAGLQVRTLQGTLLSAPYTVAEGVALVFDATSSHTNPPDPGFITGYQWDWNYNGTTFTPDPTTTLSTHSRSFPQDTKPGNPPYRVRLRVVDDDSTVETPSDDYKTVEVTVTDIPPQGQILVCNAALTVCSPPQATPVVVDEGTTGAFRVRDNSANPDPVTGIQWDLDYQGSFNPDPTLNNLTTISKIWTTVGLRQIAARIIDSDGGQSTAVMDLHIKDIPPTGRITPAGIDNILTTDEGDVVVFSSQTSTLAPGNRFARFRWDDNFTGGVFNPNPQFDLESTCTVGGTCSRFTWLTCTTADDCPLGRGTISKTMGDGPRTLKIALCVEDADAPGVCVAGANPESESIKPRIHVLEVRVRNVAPSFDPDYLPPLTIDEGTIFSWCPVIIERAGLSADPVSFDCDPTKLVPNMECNPQTGCLNWTPSAEDVSCTAGERPRSYSLTVCDDDGGCSTLNRTVEVRNVNNSPSIIGFNGGGTALAGQLYTATLYAEDPDSRCGDALFYYLCGDTTPQMTIDLNGIYRWTPTSAHVGTRTVRMCVRDRDGTADCSICHSQQITVAPQEEVPSISLGPDRTVKPGFVCLEGSILTNPGDRTLTYVWRQNSGPQDVCFQDITDYPDPPKVCFASTARGVYDFGLSANNGQYTGETSVRLTLSNTQPGPVVPGDRNYEPGVLIELDGSRSSDYNANDASLLYSWTDWREVLASTTVAVPSFSPSGENAIGLYEFELYLDDGQMSSPPGRGYMTVEVMEQDDSGRLTKALPYAYFRPLVCDQEGHCEDGDTLHPKTGEEFILDGSASTSRPSGGDLIYAWDYLEDGPSSPSWGTSASARNTLRVTAYAGGHYTFALRVTEGNIRSRLFARTVTVDSTSWVYPVAKAGDDMKVALAEQCPSPQTHYVRVDLDGSASHHPGFEAFTYHWTQVGGIPVPLHAEGTARPYFYAFEPGLYTFDLVLDDINTSSAPDQVHVAVAAPGGVAPFVTISHPRYNRERRTITADPGQEVVIDASGSGSPLGLDLDFEWSQLGGPPVALSSWTDEIVSFTPDISGQTYLFNLLLWDENGSPSLPFELKVTVLKAENTPPVCEVAESLIETVVGNVVELDASPTHDINEDDVLTYEWIQIEGESVAPLTITHADQTVALVQPTTTGDYVFEFVANDSFEDCEPVRVTVQAAANSAPTANAGADLSACVGQTIQLDGTASQDPDGHALGYAWSIQDDGNTGIVTEDFQPSRNDPKPTLPAFNPGTLTIELVVTDGFEGGSSAPDTLTVRIRSLCDGVDCQDEDEDGYFVGEDCDFDDPDTPYDCDDTDRMKNEGIIGSCSAEPEPDGDEADGDVTKKGGGGCETTGGFPPSGWLVMGLLLGLSLTRRRGARIAP